MLVPASTGGLPPWVTGDVSSDKGESCEWGKAQEESVAPGGDGQVWESGTRRFASCSGLSLWLVVRWCLAGPSPTDRGLLCKFLSKAPPQEGPRLSSRIIPVRLLQPVILFPSSSSLETCDISLLDYGFLEPRPGSPRVLEGATRHNNYLLSPVPRPPFPFAGSKGGGFRSQIGLDSEVGAGHYCETCLEALWAPVGFRDPSAKHERGRAVCPTCHRAQGTLFLWASHCIKNIQQPILQLQ